MTALVSLAIYAAGAFHGGRQKTRLRRREAFSEAFEWCVSYKEFPYVTRRRRASTPEDERIRISGEMRRVQERISYYSVWIAAENRKVAATFNALVTQLRRVAGGQVHQAWKVTPVANDEDMNMPDLGLGELREYEEAYLEAVFRALHPVRARLQLLGRVIRRVVLGAAGPVTSAGRWIRGALRRRKSE